MKTVKLIKPIALLLTVLMLAGLTSCGPSYVGVRTAPGYGYYGARPYYGYGYRPYGYYRPAPVIVQRRTYVVPRTRYYSSPSPNARSGSGSYNGGSRSYSPRSGGSRGPR